MFYIKLGIRNLKKHGRRTALTLATVAIGLACLLAARGFMNYSLWGLRESIINGGTGHYQIFRKGFTAKGDEDSYGYLMADYKKTIRALSALGGIRCIAPRLSFTGLLSSEDRSAVVMGWGGSIDEEKALTGFSTITQGSYPGPDDAYGILVGGGVADIASLDAGGPAVLSVSLADGAVNAMDFTLSGTIANQLEEMENVFACIPLKTAQTLLDSGDAADSLIVLLSDTDDMERLGPEIAAICEEAGLEYRRWDEIMPYYGGAREFYASSMNVAIAVILAILVFSVANTMSMIIFDRMPEIGTMRSLGTRGTQIFNMMVCESALMAIAGCALGIAAALFLARLNNAAGGITLPPPPGNSRPYQGMISIDGAGVALYSSLVVSVSLLASALPALKAAKMSIADTMRSL